MSRKTNKWLPFLIVSLTIIILIFFSIREVSRRDLIKKFVVKQIEGVFQREVVIDRVKLTIFPELAITGEGLILKEHEGLKPVTVRKVSLNIDWLNLIKGDIIFKEVVLTGPTVYLTRDKEGDVDLFKSINKKGYGITALLIERVSIEDGAIYFRDDIEGYPPLDLKFNNTSLFLEGPISGKSIDVSLLTKMVHGDRVSDIELMGMITPADGEVSISNLSWALEGSFAPFDATLINRYVSETVNLNISQGTVRGYFLLNGNPYKEFSLSGALESSDLEATLVPYYTKPLTFNKAGIFYNLIYDGSLLNIREFKVRFDDLILEGGLKFPYDSTGMQTIEGSLSSSWFSIPWLNQHLPESPDLSSLLSNINTGRAIIKEAVFKGRLNYMLDPLLYDEKKPITLDMAFQDVELSEPSKLSGELTLEGDKVRLKNIKGVYATIPVIGLAGEVSNVFSSHPEIDLSINTSFMLKELKSILYSDPFPATLRERLLPFTYWTGQAGIDLNIKAIYGAEEKPAIKGKVSFKDAGFNYAALNLPVTEIQGEVVITNNNIESIKVEGIIGDISTKITGSMQNYNGEEPGINMKGTFKGSGQSLRELISSFVPEDTIMTGMITGQFSASGRLSNVVLKVYLDITSSGYGLEGGVFKPEGLENSLDIEGRYKREGGFSFSSAQYRLNGEKINLNGMTGYLKITVDDLNLLKIKGILPSSAISNLGGRVKGDIIFKGSFVKGDVKTEGEIRFFNLSFVPFPPSPPIKDLTLTVVLNEDSIDLPYLFLYRGKSILKVKGILKDLEHPKVTFSLSSPNFDTDDFPPSDFIKTLLRRFLPGAVVEGKINMEKGGWHSIEFRSLKTGVSYKDDRWTLSPLEVSMDDGVVTGKWERSSFGDEAYNILNLKIVNADIEKVIKEQLKRDRIMTGIFDADIKLTWEGRNKEEVLKTLKGTISTKLQDGRIFKLFEVLPKLLTVLNPLRIITLDLKEFADQGMMYKDVTADFIINNKLLVTNNLVINGKELRIVWIGEIELSTVEIDSLMAVQPFETIDKLIGETIGRIPLLGEIIVGKDRKLLVLYYKVSGDLEKPEVKDINLKEMAQGIINRLNIIPDMMNTKKGKK
ncbi:MAG: AsmA-like C-terminal domain-containing protein [Thermodesulfobacteriota bacterium]